MNGPIRDLCSLFAAGVTTGVIITCTIGYCIKTDTENTKLRRQLHDIEERTKAAEARLV